MAIADLEEEDDPDNEEDDQADRCRDPAEEGNDQHESAEDLADGDLHGLTGMEHSIGRFLSSEQCDDNANDPHQVCRHGEDLVFRNILGSIFCSVVLEIDRISGLGSGECGSAIRTYRGAFFNLSAAIRTKRHSNTFLSSR